jgi:hypothetical protein
MLAFVTLTRPCLLYNPFPQVLHTALRADEQVIVNDERMTLSVQYLYPVQAFFRRSEIEAG